MGKVISSVFGSENESKAEAPKVDARAYNYGGREGFAEEQRNRFQQMGEGAQGRQASTGDWRAANQDGAHAQQARGQQQQALNLMMLRATGQAPSIARMSADRGMQQAAAAQASAAASARGPAGLALAQQGAANNTANAQSSINAQAQIAEAQERLAAEQAAMGGATGIRGQDYQGQQNAMGMAQFDAQQQAQQRAQNDAFQMGMVNNELAVNNAQMTGQMNQQAQQSGNQLGAAGINAQVAEGNAGRAQQNAMGIMGMAGSAAGAAAGAVSDARAKYALPGRADGGPVARGQAYLVGERGPEIVVPGQDGTVIPNEVASQLAPSTWGTGGPNLQAQGIARLRAENASNNVNAAIRQAEAYKDPYQRDVERVQVLRAITPDLVNEEDERQERVGIARMGLTRKTQAKEKQAASKEAPKGEPKGEPKKSAGAQVGGALSEVGGNFSRMAASAPVAHISTGNFAPQLLALPGRANGGPVSGGQAYVVGERGAELIVPGRGPNPYQAKDASTVLAPSGGMDVMGTIQKFSDMSGAYASPVGKDVRPSMGSMMMSDNRSKIGMRADGGPVAKGRPYVVGERGPEVVVPEAIDLDEVDPGQTIDLDKPAFDQRDASAGLWFRRGTKDEQRADLRRFQDKAAAEADSMMAGFEKSLGEGPAVSKALARANRSMEGSSYAYKPEFTPEGQVPGERNVGPMAQNMAADPIASTAVKRDPATGMLMLDRDKTMKLNSAGIAALQRQVDQLKRGGGVSRMKKKRPSTEPKT